MKSFNRRIFNNISCFFFSPNVKNCNNPLTSFVCNTFKICLKTTQDQEFLRTFTLCHILGRALLLKYPKLRKVVMSSFWEKGKSLWNKFFSNIWICNFFHPSGALTLCKTRKVYNGPQVANFIVFHLGHCENESINKNVKKKKGGFSSQLNGPYESNCKFVRKSIQK